MSAAIVELPESILAPVQRIEGMGADELAATIRDLERFVLAAGDDEGKRGWAELMLDCATAKARGESATEKAEVQFDLLVKLRDARLRAEARHAAPLRRTVWVEGPSGKLRRR